MALLSRNPSEFSLMRLRGHLPRQGTRQVPSVDIASTCLPTHVPHTTNAGPPWNASCAASEGASTEILIKSSGEILMKSYRVARLDREIGISMTGPILCVFEHVQVICTYSHTNHAYRTLMSMRKTRPRLALEWILLRRFWRVDSITKRAAF